MYYYDNDCGLADGGGFPGGSLRLRPAIVLQTDWL